MPALGQYAPGTYFRPCDGCGTSFKVRSSDVRKAKARGNQPPRFCSVACQHDSYRGDGNPKWRGGTFIANGYVYQHAPDHPHATQDGYVMQHRLVVEARIGRFLDPAEEVHHRNHVRDDNRDENLQLMPSKSAHRAEHGGEQFHRCLAGCGTEIRSVRHQRRSGLKRYCSVRCSAPAGLEAARAANAARWVAR